MFSFFNKIFVAYNPYNILQQIQPAMSITNKMNKV